MKQYWNRATCGQKSLNNSTEFNFFYEFHDEISWKGITNILKPMFTVRTTKF
jgi:hypothetical protein